MKARDFDRRFDANKDITSHLDIEKMRRPGIATRRVNIDFPEWMIDRLDREAGRVGVTRQSIIKMWISERLEHRGTDR
ncbi:MAG TPA: CopG family transcriptional regulator [Spirochaetota bacterium]|nr:CopG family transcriptional regulator [Spirochaetota bacterium]